MFRSEYPKQRMLSLRVLSGVLQRREMVVSLPAYAHEEDQNDEMYGAAAAPSSTGSSGIGTYSNFAGLSEVFLSTVREVVAYIQNAAAIARNTTSTSTVVTNSTISAVVVAAASQAQTAAPIMLSHSQRTNIRHAVMQCFLTACTPDFPEQRPSLLLCATCGSGTSSFAN